MCIHSANIGCLRCATNFSRPWRFRCEQDARSPPSGNLYSSQSPRPSQGPFHFWGLFTLILKKFIMEKFKHIQKQKYDFPYHPVCTMIDSWSILLIFHLLPLPHFKLFLIAWALLHHFTDSFPYCDVFFPLDSEIYIYLSSSSRSVCTGDFQNLCVCV